MTTAVPPVSVAIKFPTPLTLNSQRPSFIAPFCTSNAATGSVTTEARKTTFVPLKYKLLPSAAIDRSLGLINFTEPGGKNSSGDSHPCNCAKALFTFTNALRSVSPLPSFSAAPTLITLIRKSESQTVKFLETIVHLGARCRIQDVWKNQKFRDETLQPVFRRTNSS